MHSGLEVVGAYRRGDDPRRTPVYGRATHCRSLACLLLVPYPAGAARRVQRLFTGVVMSGTTTRAADEGRRERERQRYRVLEAIYRSSRGRCIQLVVAREVARDLGMLVEELYKSICDLQEAQLLDYLGAGPRVCLTDTGIDYIERVADRRRSVRH